MSGYHGPDGWKDEPLDPRASGNDALDEIAEQHAEAEVSDGYLREREQETGEQFGYDAGP